MTKLTMDEREKLRREKGMIAFEQIILPMLRAEDDISDAFATTIACIIQQLAGAIVFAEERGAAIDLDALIRMLPKLIARESELLREVREEGQKERIRKGITTAAAELVQRNQTVPTWGGRRGRGKEAS